MRSRTLIARSRFILKSLAVAVLASGLLFVEKAIACRDAPPVQAAATSAIEGTYLRMSGAEVLERFGAPQSALQRNLRCTTEVYLSYPELLIKIQVPPGLTESDALESAAQGVVREFVTSDPNFSTQAGISIGASRSTLIDTYGTPQPERSLQGDTLLSYRQLGQGDTLLGYRQANYTLMFLMRDDRVAEIQYSY